MRYFLMEQDEDCIDAPSIINWYDKLDVRKIERGLSGQLPQRVLLDIRENASTVFTDIISTPFLLYSKKVKDSVHIYEPKMPDKQIVLLDSTNHLTELYFMPILERFDCLSDKSELSRDGSVVLRAILDEAQLPDRSIFKLGGTSGVYTIVRLDLAESMLRRGVRGVSLKEVDVL